MINSFYNKVVRKLYSLAEDIWLKKQSFFIKKNTLLVLRLDSIGDYIIFRNFIQVLKESEKYKNYSITLCGNVWWKDLAENLDAAYIDRYIWIDYPKMSDFKYCYKMQKKIHSKGYEVLIHSTFSRDIISDGIVIHSGAKEKIGYNGDLINLQKEQKDKNDLSYTVLIPSVSKFRFEFYRNLDFFEQLLSKKIDLLKPKINHLTTIENKVVICPGAKDAFRRWSPINFAKLSALLKNEFGIEEFIICGSYQDSWFAKQIIDNSNLNFTDVTGKLSLIQLIELMAQAKLIVTNDSGPFHIAVALDKTVVCLSNGNNYGRFTPYPEQMDTKSLVIYPKQILSFSEEERLKKFCKEVKDVDINEISVDLVFSEIKKKLSN